MSQHATPLMIGPGGVESLQRVPLVETLDGVRYDEAFVEDLLFQNPSVLPIRELDSVYSDPVPICTQLPTKVGPLDVLYVTKEGRLVIVEAKLWRNPEARRKVVAQIIDYAAELGRWSFTDLDREVSRRLGGAGVSLFSLVKARHPEIQEAEFVDSVSRSLREGRFLLLICGDGIREELTAIAEFLDRGTTLDMTFGLVELAIYSTGDDRRLVLPRVLAKTLTIRRQVFRVEGAVVEVRDEVDEVAEPRPTAAQSTFVQFWTELAEAMSFDDANQPTITIARAPNTTLRMPTPRAWVTLYLSSSSGAAGVFLTFNKGEPGDTLHARLLEDQEKIRDELPPDAQWSSKDGKHIIGVTIPLPDIGQPADRQAAIQWFSAVGNQFVNAFRPRLSRYLSEM